MIYFKDFSGNVFGYCPDTQKDLIEKARKSNLQELAKGAWPPFSLADSLDLQKIEINKRLTKYATDRKYDSAESMASYASSSVKEWAAEAKAFVKFRDTVWKWYFDKCATVKNVDGFFNDFPKEAE